MAHIRKYMYLHFIPVALIPEDTEPCQLAINVYIGTLFLWLCGLETVPMYMHQAYYCDVSDYNVAYFFCP